jgi:hypothetical protein
MEKIGSDVPLLYIDNSEQSKEALAALRKSHKDFVTVEVESHEDLKVPILFTTIGVFYGLLAISGYALSIFGSK